MAAVTVRFIGPGPDKLVAAHVAKLEAATKRAIRDLTLATEREVKLELSKPGSGRVYRSRIGGVHRASAPGQPPAVDTGSYRRSWQSRFEDGGLVGIAGTGDERGDWLEHGTTRMAPRPHLEAAVERALGGRSLAAHIARHLNNL
jgi:hypothetical protein